MNNEDLKAAVPPLSGTIQVKGLEGYVEVYRDGHGIPHVSAASQRAAFFAQGFVTAQDRLWHMECDRRRGAGRWAEVVGPQALKQDIQMRRFRLEASARADYWASDAFTRELLDAYARGVNAFIGTTPVSPIEYQITGLTLEPWQPWDGLIAYKVRHLSMGMFEAKTWRARLVSQLGPEKAATLFPGYQPGQPLILPPGAAYAGPLLDGLEELGQGAAALNYLKEMDSGSNSWVISGQRAASGKPILAGDSHRGLDTPNVYYQIHLACPDFDVIGLSLPGLMGFPHFGHTQQVAWCITHTSADYQDLYIERFQPDYPQFYLYQDQWRRAEVYQETIKVKGSESVTIPVFVTQHGPVISGNPESGAAIAFRYTATDGPSAWPDILWQMLPATTVQKMMEHMREWVDPCNNFLLADVDGNIGYLCRGQIPIRSATNGWLPVPGWTGEHEWQGYIPFEELPRSVNPPEGYFATANNKPVGEDYPYYISTDFAPGFRVERVTRALLSLEKAVAADMAQVHAERLSIPAQTYVKLLKQVEPADHASAQAREKLLAWSGQMDASSVEATIYSALQDALIKELLKYNLGDALTAIAWNPADRGRSIFISRFKNLVLTMMEQDDRHLLPPGQDWPSMLSRALAQGVSVLKERLGSDPTEWQWERIHQARPRHTLSSDYPDVAALLDPPPIPMSGDADTPLAGAYSPANPATVTSLSVARYAFDLADWDNSLWAVPLGSSGHPGSPHYYDQSKTWRQVQMIPMEYTWERIVAGSCCQQRLEPV